MPIIDSSKMSEYSSGIKVGPGALIDPTLAGLGREYKKNIASRYKLLSEGDIRTLPEEKYYTSLKYDGQMHFLYKDKNDIFLYNPRGRVCQGLGLINEAAEQLKGLDQVLLAGELYVGDKDRSRVYDVTSALGVDGGERAEQLVFGVFNVLQVNGDSRQGLSFKENLEWMQENLPATGQFHLIEHSLMERTDIGKRYSNDVVENGQEGLICTAGESPIIYKVKPRHNIDAVIIGFTERPDEPETVRVLLTALMRPDGSFQVFSKVGTGFDEDKRREIFRLLKGDAVESDYKEVDRNHTLFTMVEPKHVIEMSFHDLITDNSVGKKQMKAVLNYEDGAYKANLPEKFVAVLAPVFKQFREDKSVNSEDLRMTQLRDLVDLDNLEEGSRKLDLANSEIIERSVFIKSAKELTNVRKFISWKTNKAELDSTYPPYVFCYVDYSPGRKAPLKRVLRTAQSLDDINEIYNLFKEQEVKKGWEEA